MRLFVYTLKYPCGHQIRHYNTNIFMKSVNDFNQQNNINHTMNLNKIHRYSSSASLPSVYLSLGKVPLAEFINADGKRLSHINYRELFDTINTPLKMSNM